MTCRRVVLDARLAASPVEAISRTVYPTCERPSWQDIFALESGVD